MQAVISVSDYLSLANQALRTIPTDGVVIEGEVAEYKVSQGKWVNFVLKDEKAEATLPCFMTVYALTTPLQNGMRVQLSGSSKVFERFGKFTFNVQAVTLVGEGALQKAYLALKEQLQRDGLFDDARKRSIPQFPERIGLITSSEAAAYGDFLRILANRWRGVTVIHIPVHVQGQYAVSDILSAFVQFNAMEKDERPDVIVLTRGGGALEDLHAFNTESVARAVFGSDIPVVVGVGHERDESLCDFVADVRASTPSNAAERVVPDARVIRSTIAMSVERMEDQCRFAIDRNLHAIDRAVGVFDHAFSTVTQSIIGVTHRFSSAFDRFRLSVIATIDHVHSRVATIDRAFRHIVHTGTERVIHYEQILRACDPKEVFRRGYAVVRSGRRIIRRSCDVVPGDRLAVQFEEGSVSVLVEGTETIKPGTLPLF